MKENAENLQRFTKAQEAIYPNVFQELQNGAKLSHWMWFIFPQIAGLGYSSTAQYYAIKSIGEAKEYLTHPTLGRRLVECTKTILAHEHLSARDIFGEIDEMKLRSSMTLFAQAADLGSVFQHALDKYFDGEPDHRTLDILSA